MVRLPPIHRRVDSNHTLKIIGLAPLSLHHTLTIHSACQPAKSIPRDQQVPEPNELRP
jgi:hypothetical protein